jgi:hypothetical protein
MIPPGFDVRVAAILSLNDGDAESRYASEPATQH